MSETMNNRQCMYCGTPIYECMGFVLARDFLAILEGTFPKGQIARELCPSKACNDKWLEELRKEEENNMTLLK